MVNYSDISGKRKLQGFRSLGVGILDLQFTV